MDSLIQLLVGDLVLSPEFIFVARCLSVCLVVHVLSSLVSVVVPLAKNIGR